MNRKERKGNKREEKREGQEGKVTKGETRKKEKKSTRREVFKTESLLRTFARKSSNVQNLLKLL